MTSPASESFARGLRGVLDSAAFASAFTLAALATVFSGFAIEHTAGRTTYVTIVVGLCVVGLGILIVRRRELALPRLVPLTLAAFLLWVLATSAWSRDPAVTIGGWITLVALAFLAIVIGQIRDTLQTARALGDVLRALLTVSLGLEILSGILLDMPFPFLGIQGNIASLGPIQGIFGTRSALGFVAIIALITFLIEYRTMSVRPGVSLYSAVLAGSLAVLSDSPTVLGVAIAVGTAVLALTLVRRTPQAKRPRVQWILGGTFAIGIIVAYVMRTPIVQLMGAGTDFARRADVWEPLFVFVRLEPVLGWGWTGPWTSGLPYGAINVLSGDRQDSAMNAYFDVLLQAGWAGLLLFVAFVGVAFVRGWLVAGNRRAIVYAWTPLMLVTLLADSFFESFTLGGFAWVLLVLCAARAGQSQSWRTRIPHIEPDSPPSASTPNQS